MSFMDGFTRTFITDYRYMFFLDGLVATLILSLLAAVIGLAIGITVCLLKITKWRKPYLRPLGWLAEVYIDVIRGTPSTVQLLIIYFIVFGSSSLNAIIVASIAFGITSGAYTAEIIRAGIQSIDVGQTEAGRSLGLSSVRTMRYVIMPQALKNILPALVNELITLIKETSIAGYIGLMDLTKAARTLEGITYDYMWPLFSIAVIYYIIIKALTIYMSRLEVRIHRSEARR